MATVMAHIVAQSPTPLHIGPLTPFQLGGVCVLGVLLVLSVTAMILGRTTRREGVGWSLVWFCAAVAIVKPELTDKVAKTLGIGRGADIVMYCSVVAMMVGFMVVYVRLRQLRREMTLIVRHLALREADSADDRSGNGLGPAQPAKARKISEGLDKGPGTGFDTRS